jgi:hypothetical protein
VNDLPPPRWLGIKALPITLLCAIAILSIACLLTGKFSAHRWTGAVQTGASLIAIDGTFDSDVHLLHNGATLRFTPTYHISQPGDSVGLDVLDAPLSLRFVLQGDGGFVIYDCSQTPWHVVAARALRHGSDVSFSIILTRVGKILKVALVSGESRAQGTVLWPTTAAKTLQLRLTATSPMDELRGFQS